MPASQCGRSGCGAQRGSVLVMVSAGMVMLLGVAGLAIDLAGLYVARNEAQRSADAAALSGAQEFVNSGFTSGLVTEAQVRTLATQKAIDSGSQNYVGIQAASILPSDVTFDFSNPANPLISVVVQRTAARSNPMPHFLRQDLRHPVRRCRGLGNGGGFQPVRVRIDYFPGSEMLEAFSSAELRLVQHGGHQQPERQPKFSLRKHRRFLFY